MTTAKEFKVEFKLDPKDEQGFETENLWAEKMGANTFRIRNSPFFVFGVSAEDIVRAEEVDGVLRFRDVVERGGHSTYRLFLQNDLTISDAAFQSRWDAISKLGATFENANDRLVAVDISPGQDVGRIYGRMKAGEEDGVWIFEEAHYGEKRGRP